MTTERQKTLIDKAIAGDEDSLLEVLLDLKDELRHFVSSKLSKSSRLQLQSEDILQETYIKVCQEIGGLKVDDIGDLLAWIKAVALNLIRDAARRQSAAKRGGDFVKLELEQVRLRDAVWGLAVELSDPGIGTPSTVAAKGEAIDAIRIAVSQLPEDQRIAMQLHSFQNLTLEETAQQMQRTSDSVRGLIQRAKKTLRNAMMTSSLWLSRKG